MAHRKIVICGAGFLGANIARAISSNPRNRIQLTSRNPKQLHDSLNDWRLASSLLPPVPADITNPHTLKPAFESADVVISLVGLLEGSEKKLEEVQWRGAENVSKAAKEVGAKLVHVSALGADKNSRIPYFRTKALGEEVVFRNCPDATIFRPSLVFGPGDSFFKRFATLAKFLPFLPVFGGGKTKFQPVFVGDLSRAVELASRREDSNWDGKIVQAGGPETFTYREMMELVLKYSNRRRPIVSLPFVVGKLQGLILEQLPHSILTVTRSQIEQLKFDNVTDPSKPTISSLVPGMRLTSVHQILPTYL